MNRSDTILSESDVSSMIQQKYGGTIENASFSQKDDEPIYRITLLKDDIPYHITVNGENGEVQSLIKQKVEKPTSTQTKNDTEEEQKKSERTTSFSYIRRASHFNGTSKRYCFTKSKRNVFLS